MLYKRCGVQIEFLIKMKIEQRSQLYSNFIHNDC